VTLCRIAGSVMVGLQIGQMVPKAGLHLSNAATATPQH
jgi:hypothetical protein